MKSSVILGIGGLEQSSSAAIMVDGKVLAAAEEERFNRLKHFIGFPNLSIEYCINEAGIERSDITDVSIGGLGGTDGASHTSDEVIIADDMGEYASYLFPNAKLHFVPHHLSHAASAFFMYELDEAAFLSIDYLAEGTPIVGGKIYSDRCEIILSVNYPHSLGMFSAAVTKYLGFEPASDEYKVMGLASYGTPEFIDEIQKIIRLKKDGTIEIAGFNPDSGDVKKILGQLSGRLVELFGSSRVAGSPVTLLHKNIAASAQAVVRNAVMHMAGHLRKTTGAKNICYTGELALNCGVNTAMADSGLFSNILVHPASHDAGTAIGTCFYVDRIKYKNHREKGGNYNVYLGPSYSNEEVRRVIDQMGVRGEELHGDELVRKCAADIADGKVVGWFQGRMEWGPRALGNRSILADPRSKGIVDRINAAVKHRESFRPFAPSVVEEDAKNYFDYPDSGDMSYMLFLARAKDITKKKAPAIVHIDGTSRIQTVSRETNPLYWKLITEFKNISGIPIVLNTSFNVMGEPIVRSPKEAIKCFMATEIDVLYAGSFRVEKKSSRKNGGNL